MSAFLGGLMISACATGPVAGGEVTTQTARSSAHASDCPVTVPPQPGLVPPEPYPPEPPFGQVWYGTPELWTNLDPTGQRWRDLPVGDDKSLSNKTLWWSERFSTVQGEDFSGNADITVTAIRLDGPAPAVVEGPGVPSFNPDVGNFMLVGLVLPGPGCWEITASYRGVELSYVVEVEG